MLAAPYGMRLISEDVISSLRWVAQAEEESGGVGVDLRKSSG
jgi:hypothetical protein